MSNLSQNIKKDLIDNLILLFLAVFLMFGFYISITKYWINDYVLFAEIGVVCLVFGLIKKFVNKKLNNWIVPEMTLTERKTYNKVDFYYGLFLGLVFISVFYYFYKEFVLVLVLFVAAMIIVREVGKKREWKKLKEEAEYKEVPVEDNLEPVAKTTTESSEEHTYIDPEELKGK